MTRCSHSLLFAFSPTFVTDAVNTQFALCLQLYLLDLLLPVCVFSCHNDL